MSCIGFEGILDVLLDSAGDEDAKRSSVISLEYVNDAVNKLLHQFLIVALIESVDDDNRFHLYENVSRCSDRLDNQFLELVHGGNIGSIWIALNSAINWLPHLWHVTV